MIARVFSSTVLGVDALLVEVEVDIVFGLPAFTTVGLPENAVKESRERVKSAIKNCGYDFPNRRITVNLAPADIKKAGTGFDLPIAVGILIAAGLCKPDLLTQYALIGELSLDGRLRPVQGLLPMVIAAREKGLTGVVVPRANGIEASAVTDVKVVVADFLHEVVEVLSGEKEPSFFDRDMYKPAPMPADSIDFNQVKGQAHVKRALEIAAAGGHNILMSGPPGSGKSMLARRLPTIMPDLSLEESLETSKIFSVCGLLQPGQGLIDKRPFRAPHHNISDAGLIGGGTVPRPGEVSLSHNGVLFLDELPEFRKTVLEALRQPLENGNVTIARAATSLTFPAAFMLVGAMNPCPCGHQGDYRQNCNCTDVQIKRYRDKLSGPLLDRIDMHLEVPAVPLKEITAKESGEASTVIKKRVEIAREAQYHRFKKRDRVFNNSKMNNRDLKTHCTLDKSSAQLLERSTDQLGLSARAYFRIIKMARTIADLEQSARIDLKHIAEAIQYRRLDRTDR